MKRKNTQDLQAKRSNNLERQSHWTSIRLFKNNIQKRQQWPHIFKQLKKKENGPRILYPATLAFQYQVYRKSFKHTRAQGISHEWALSEGSTKAWALLKQQITGKISTPPPQKKLMDNTLIHEIVDLRLKQSQILSWKSKIQFLYIMTK